MKLVSSFGSFLRSTAAAVVALCAVVGLLSASAAATPITYTAFTITDGKLGSWSFHNARVYISLQSDTTFVQFFQPLIDPTNPSGGTVDTYINTAGTATVTVISGSKVVRATIAPNQIFASMDLGDTVDAPHVGARGLGFSSFSSTVGIEPSYPLGLEDGTLDWGDILGVASDGLQNLPIDLVSNTAFSGRAWPCTGFPNRACAPPAPLTTDKGDFYLYLPYQDYDPVYLEYGDSLSAGFFTATLNGSSSPAPSLPSTPVDDASKPIIYRGYTVADVQLGRRSFTAAEVYLSVDADAASATAFSNGSAHGFQNIYGHAHVTVVSGGKSYSADINPGQVYVYFDIAHASIGFGSWAGGTGYPLTITANEDSGDYQSGLVENSSVGAISDILQNPTDIQFYTPATGTLGTDLTTPTVLSGSASSCIAFDPATSVCSNLTPVPLRTSRGDFYMYEPYTEDETVNGGPGPYSVNWGVFWIEKGQRRGH